MFVLLEDGGDGLSRPQRGEGLCVIGRLWRRAWFRELLCIRLG